MQKAILSSCLLLMLILMGFLDAEEISSSKRIKLVILDNSGTLNDCGVYAPVVSFIQLFEKYGMKISMEEARIPMGLYKKDHIRSILAMQRVSALFQDIYHRAWNEEDVEKMFVDFVPIQLNCLEQYANLIPGAAETLASIREKYGVKIGLTTGFDEEMNELVLRKAKEQGFIPDAYISSSQVPKGRPYWYMIEENMRQAGVTDPEEVLKVGDTYGDMQEGKAMRAIKGSATWTLGLSTTGNYVGKLWEEIIETPGDVLQKEQQTAEALLYRAGADYVAPNLHSLPTMIELINRRLEAGEKPRPVPLDFLK